MREVKLVHREARAAVRAAEIETANEMEVRARLRIAGEEACKLINTLHFFTTHMGSRIRAHLFIQINNDNCGSCVVYTNFEFEIEGAARYEHGVQDPFEWVLGMKTKHFIDDCASLFLIHSNIEHVVSSYVNPLPSRSQRFDSSSNTASMQTQTTDAKWIPSFGQSYSRASTSSSTSFLSVQYMDGGGHQLPTSLWQIYLDSCRKLWDLYHRHPLRELGGRNGLGKK